MKLLITLLLLLPAAAFSQYRVTVILDKVPAGTGDNIFITGNFNEWNASDENALLTKGTDGKFIKVFDDVQAGEYEFKFTMGSTESLEVGADGKDISNRVLKLSGDTTIHMSVARWKNAKSSFTENTSTWSNLLPPSYNSIAMVRKQDGVISKSRQTLRKS